MKKGFTLIELLAVIVILAIISLIATPVILSIIDDAKKISDKVSAENYIDALSNAIAVKNFNGMFSPSSCFYYDGVTTCNGEVLDVEFDGEIDLANALINSGKVSYYSVSFSNGNFVQNKSTDESCFISVSPGEIDAYICNDTEVYFPANLKLGVITGFKSMNYNESKCMLHYSEGQCNSFNGIFLEYGQTEDIDLNDFLQFLVVKGVVNQAVIEYSVNVASILASYSDIFDIVYNTSEKILVKKIGWRVFENKNLKTVAFNNAIEEIGLQSFYNNKISNLLMPNGLVNIGNSAFNDNELTEVILPDSVKIIGDGAFSGYEYYSNHSYNNINKLRLGKSITEIGSSAFNDNELTEVILPLSLVEIHDNAFYANKISSLVIPNGVTTIGTSAFSNNFISNLVISSSVTSVASWAFDKNCLTSENVVNNSSASFTINYDNQNNCN